jgi:hypothetical protein
VFAANRSGRQNSKINHSQVWRFGRSPQPNSRARIERMQRARKPHIFKRMGNPYRIPAVHKFGDISPERTSAPGAVCGGGPEVCAKGARTMEIFNPGVRARKKLVSSISRLGVAEGVGFEPTIRFPVYTLSKRAPSATRPPLRRSQRAHYSGRIPSDNQRDRAPEFKCRSPKAACWVGQDRGRWNFRPTSALLPGLEMRRRGVTGRRPIAVAPQNSAVKGYRGMGRFPPAPTRDLRRRA